MPEEEELLSLLAEAVDLPRKVFFVFDFFCKCEDSSNRASKNLLCCLYVNRFFL
jgi:hypothetical protein